MSCVCIPDLVTCLSSSKWKDFFSRWNPSVCTSCMENWTGYLNGWRCICTIVPNCITLLLLFVLTKNLPKVWRPVIWVQEDFRSQEVISSFFRADDIFCDFTFCWGRFCISVGDHALESIRRYVYTSSLAMNFVEFVITFTNGSGRQTKPSDAMFWRFSMEVNAEPSGPKLGHFIFKKCVMGGHCLLLRHVLQGVGQTTRQEKV